MLIVNTDIQDCLINDQTGNISHIKLDKVHKVYVKLSNVQSDLKSIRSIYLGRKNYWIPIEKCETNISMKTDQHLHPSSVFNFL